MKQFSSGLKLALSDVRTFRKKGSRPKAIVTYKAQPRVISWFKCETVLEDCRDWCKRRLYRAGNVPIPTQFGYGSEFRTSYFLLRRPRRYAIREMLLELISMSRWANTTHSSNAVFILRIGCTHFFLPEKHIENLLREKR